MCRTCGDFPSVSALRCSTPKRCCSSTTATARSRNTTPSWISAWVPTTTSAFGASSRSRLAEELVSNAHVTPRRVQRPERVHALGEGLLLLHVGRKRVAESTGKRSADELAQLLGGDLLARGVDRSEVGGRLSVTDVEAAHVEAVAPLTPAQAYRSSRLQLALEPRLVEPGRVHGRRTVGDARRQHLQPPAPTDGRRQHFSRDRHLLIRPEVRHAYLRHGLLVPKRPVRE